MPVDTVKLRTVVLPAFFTETLMGTRIGEP